MPRSQLQRLRCQLAASRDEVHALEQKIIQLGAASVAAAEEHAVTERFMLGRLADADAHCRKVEQRAAVAEIQLLQYAESEQRSGLIEGEDRALGEVCDMFPAAVEVASRTELAAAEEAAWTNLATAQAANREAVKRRRKSLRKKRQKDRRREQERRNRGEPILQADESIGRPPSEFATAHSVISTAADSASSTPVSGYNALFVDNICFWIAALVPYSWAPVCSKAARTVFRVMHIYDQGWVSIGFSIARFQSMGSHYDLDHEHLGPECGLLYAANRSVQALRNEVYQMMRSNPAAAPPLWASRFVLHMDFQMNIYEMLRLEHKSLYIAFRDLLITYRAAVGHIGQALEAFDQGELAEVDEVGAAGRERS